MIKQLIPIDSLRCQSTANGLQRCVLSRGHAGEHQFTLRAERVFHLRITHRMVENLMSMVRAERKRRVRELEKNRHRGWKPAPGHHDRNRMIIEQIDDMMKQIEPQLKAADPQFTERVLMKGLEVEP